MLPIGFGSIIILWLLYLIWSYATSPIKGVPGPFLAKFTNLWRLIHVFRGNPALEQRRLHEKYGPAVRLGPNMVSLNDPGLIKTVYSFKGDFRKSDHYAVNDVMLEGKQITNLFATRSNEYRNKQVKPVRKEYGKSAVLKLEPIMDRTLSLLEKKLDEKFVNTGKSCTLEDWLLYYAWDLTSEITFDQNFGFLETGGDVFGLIRQSEAAVSYFGVIGQMPKLDYLLDKNPILPLMPSGFAPILAWTANRIKIREQGKSDEAKHRAYVDFFLQLKQDIDWVDDGQVLAWSMNNVNAGSDTLSIVLAATTYLILSHPLVHQRLLSELRSGSSPLPRPIPLGLSSRLPYLDAIITESMRLHAPVAMPLERVVPPGTGLHLDDGRVLPPGTIVGMNAQVVQRDKITFAPDHDAFRPERWLRNEDESEDEWAARKRQMRQTELVFGAGMRSCLGKELALVEVSKTIATIFANYDIELVHPERELRMKGNWFLKPKGIEVRLKRCAS